MFLFRWLLFGVLGYGVVFALVRFSVCGIVVIVRYDSVLGELYRLVSF